MKKIMTLLLLVFLVGYIFAVDTEVVAVTGKTQVQLNGKWTTPKTGQKLSVGTMISTGFKSTMTVKIDGSVLVVQPLTRLKLSEIMAKEDAVSSEVYLETGSIKANIKPKSTKKVNFKVKTPVATASVRGTSGQITASGKLEGYTGVWAYDSVGMNSFVRSGDTVVYHADGTVEKSIEVLEIATNNGVPKSLAAAYKGSLIEGVDTSLQEVASSGVANVDFTIDW